MCVCMKCVSYRTYCMAGSRWRPWPTSGTKKFARDPRALKTMRMKQNFCELNKPFQFIWKQWMDIVCPGLRECVRLSVCLSVCLCVFEDKHSFRCQSRALLVCSPATNFMWRKSLSQCPQECVKSQRSPVKLDLKTLDIGWNKKKSVKNNVPHMNAILLLAEETHMGRFVYPENLFPGVFFCKGLGLKGRRQGSWEGNFLCKAILEHLFTFSLHFCIVTLLYGPNLFKLSWKFSFVSGEGYNIMSLQAKFLKWDS